MDSIQAVFEQLDKSAAEWTSGKISLTVLQQMSQQLGSSESGFKDIAYWQRAIECYEVSINSALLLVSTVCFCSLGSADRALLGLGSVALHNDQTTKETNQIHQSNQKLLHLVRTCCSHLFGLQCKLYPEARQPGRRLSTTNPQCSYWLLHGSLLCRSLCHTDRCRKR